MDIAILLSTYNGTTYLAEQMDSIVNQSVDGCNVQLYVRDDGSADNTIELLESYRDKIDIKIIQGKNIGPEKSFWELFTDPGIKADYYAFSDQDDIWDSDKLEKGIKAIDSKSGPGFWCSNCRLIDMDGRLVKELYHMSNPAFTLPAQFICGTNQGCSMLFNDELRQSIIVKTIDPIPMHDFVVITHAIHMNCLTYDPEPSFSYRIHGNNYYGKGDGFSVSEIRKTLHRWFAVENRNVFSKYLNSFLISNREGYDEKEKQFLEDIACSKGSIVKRFKVIMNPLCRVENKRAVRSFRIRILFGVF